VQPKVNEHLPNQPLKTFALIRGLWWARMRGLSRVTGVYVGISGIRGRAAGPHYSHIRSTEPQDSRGCVRQIEFILFATNWLKYLRAFGQNFGQGSHNNWRCEWWFVFT